MAVVERDGGVFPDDEARLRELPGIGEYTAAAIAAIAFDRPSAVMDGNIERVMARMFAVTQPLPGAKPLLKQRVASLTPLSRPGDYAQAAMDLGAMICTPKKPACSLCPWQSDCRARQMGIAESLPAKTVKAARPIRYGVAFWLQTPERAVLLRRRAERGLLGGMMEIPSTEWRGEAWTWREALHFAPIPGDWRPVPGLVSHGFTHFQLQLTIATLESRAVELRDGVWCRLDRLGEQALPTVMKKLVRHAGSFLS
jgi:A/G-specific adenine glycosylase